MQREVCCTSAERMLMCVEAGWRLTGFLKVSTGLDAALSTVDDSCSRQPLAKRAQA
jgi:hypothetical protein